MKIILIHGDNLPKVAEILNNYVGRAKSKNWEIAKFNQEGNLSLSEFLSSGSLFGEKRLFLVDAVSKISPKEITWLKRHGEALQGYLLLLNEGALSPKIIKAFPRDIKIEEAKLPKLIFTFLDAFYPKNAPTVMKALKELIKSEPMEFIVALLGRRLRDLAWIKSGNRPFPYENSWYIGKLSSQAKLFKDGQIEHLVSALAEADMAVKTSQASMNDLLDQIIITHLE